MRNTNAMLLLDAACIDAAYTTANLIVNLRYERGGEGAIALKEVWLDPSYWFCVNVYH